MEGEEPKDEDKFGSHTRKAFKTDTTEGSCTWNITHNTDSTAVWNLKSGRWGSLLVQEVKYQEEKACDKRPTTTTTTTTNNNNNMLNQSFTKLNLPPRLLFLVQKLVIRKFCSIVRKHLDDEIHLPDEEARNH
jgi:hypothetical protein